MININPTVIYLKKNYDFNVINVNQSVITVIY